MMDSFIRAFMLACLRSKWQPEALEIARSLAVDEGFDWDSLLEAARADSVAPLLYATLREQGIMPGRVEQELRRAFDGTALRNTFLFGRLEEALAVLAGSGIPAILLKGAALSRTIYAGLPVRPMGDLDLLVRREEAPAALAALHSAGWETTEAEARDGLALAYEIEVGLHKAGPIVSMLEVHWGLLDSPFYQRKLPIDWLWETARSIRFGVQDALILGPEAQLLHLCAHLALHHRGEGPLWYHDIAALILAEGERVNWQELLARAQSADLVLPLQRCLLRLAGDWDVPMPADVLIRLRALRPSADECRLFERLSAPERPVIQRFFTDLAAIASWRERVDYAWSSICPSPAYMRQRFGINQPVLTPIYYPYRLYLGLREALTSLRKG
jgi:hypothetical protein